MDFIRTILFLLGIIVIFFLLIVLLPVFLLLYVFLPNAVTKKFWFNKRFRQRTGGNQEKEEASSVNYNIPASEDVVDISADEIKDKKSK